MCMTDDGLKRCDLLNDPRLPRRRHRPHVMHHFAFSEDVTSPLSTLGGSSLEVFASNQGCRSALS